MLTCQAAKLRHKLALRSSRYMRPVWGLRLAFWPWLLWFLQHPHSWSRQQPADSTSVLMAAHTDRQNGHVRRSSHHWFDVSSILAFAPSSSQLILPSVLMAAHKQTDRLTMLVMTLIKLQVFAGQMVMELNWSSFQKHLLRPTDLRWWLRTYRQNSYFCNDDHQIASACWFFYCRDNWHQLHQNLTAKATLVSHEPTHRSCDERCFDPYFTHWQDLCRFSNVWACSFAALSVSGSTCVSSPLSDQSWGWTWSCTVIAISMLSAHYWCWDRYRSTTALTDVLLITRLKRRHIPAKHLLWKVTLLWSIQ